MMQYVSPSINHLHAVSINQYVLLGNWCVLNKCSFSLSFSFPSPRSFPSLSLCQKSTANSKSSSMLVWNTLKTYTSGTPACRLSAFGLKFLPLLIKLMFSDYWNFKHFELVIAMYCPIPVPTSLSFCDYSLYLFITHTSKQTNRFSLPDSFHSDKGTWSYYNWRIWGNTTLQYSNQGPFLFHILLRLNNLICVCVCVCVLVTADGRINEYNTATLLEWRWAIRKWLPLSRTIPQCWDSARLIHTGCTLSNIYSPLHIWKVSIYCACVSSQVCILSLHMSTHAQFLFKFVCTSVFMFIWTCVCGSVCWFSVGAGNQEGTIDPWRVGGKKGEGDRRSDWKRILLIKGLALA